jgi:hypothetical protein
MNAIILKLSLILIPFGIVFQTRSDPNDFEVIFKRSGKVSNYEFKSSDYHISNYSAGVKKVRIRISVKSNNDKLKKFDANKLYLVSNELKQRYRPIDLQYQYFINTYMGLDRLTTDSTLANGNTDWVTPVNYIRYNPQIRDTFRDYMIPGYEDIEIEVNYGSSGKPHKVVVYFKPIEVISYIFDVYFAVPQSLNSGIFYYGSEVIKECGF